MHECSLQTKVKNLPKCNWCHRGCVVPEGGYSYCGNNTNNRGKLYSAVYAKPVSVAVDPIEKKPLYHFLPGTPSFSIATTGCNFHCQHCQNYQISQAKPGERPTTDMPPGSVVKQAINYACKSIAYTYTEPTVFYDYAHDTGVLARKKGLKNVFVTNGYSSPELLKHARCFLDAANIDIKGDEKFYKKVCDADYENVLRTVKEYHKQGYFIEITTLIIPGYNDSKDFAHEIASFLKDLSRDIPWHFSAFYPAYKMMNTKPTPPQTVTSMCEIAKDEGMRYVYAGNIFRSDYDDTHCHKCGKLLIRRSGYQTILITNKPKCPECGQKLPIVMN